MAREIIGIDSFVEVYVSIMLDICMERDVKDYTRKQKRARSPILRESQALMKYRNIRN